VAEEHAVTCDGTSLADADDVVAAGVSSLAWEFVAEIVVESLLWN
jgi:hypothetical protein